MGAWNFLCEFFGSRPSGANDEFRVARIHREAAGYNHLAGQVSCPLQDIVDSGPMPGQEERVCFLCSLARRTGARIALGVSCQSLEFVVAPRLAEHAFISSSREDRSELLAYQSRT